MKRSFLQRLRERRGSRVAAPEVSTDIAPSEPEASGAKTYGIKETSELVIFLAAATTAAFQASEDGLGIGDLTIALGLMDEGVAALRGLADVDDELRDLTAQELEQLTKIVSDRLLINNDSANKIIPAVIGMAPGLLKLIKVIVDLKGDDE